MRMRCLIGAVVAAECLGGCSVPDRATYGPASALQVSPAPEERSTGAYGPGQKPPAWSRADYQAAIDRLKRCGGSGCW